MIKRGDWVVSIYGEYNPHGTIKECTVVGMKGDTYCTNIDGSGWKVPDFTHTSKIDGSTYILEDNKGRQRAFHHTFVEKVADPEMLKKLLLDMKEEFSV